MGLTTSELTITYAGVTFGGATARQITGWTRDEHDYPTGAFEFEFVTTAASDAAFATELDTVRNALRRPRQDLVVMQNGAPLLSRKHSTNTGLDTSPYIVKDGDPSDTGRSRHFRVRIAYELPADNVGTSFRRGATVTVSYTPSRRRTVMVSGLYTANSTDGTTTADAQYLAEIAAAETALLNTVDSTATWERVGQPEIEYFETRKLCRFTRVYREINLLQSSGTLDNADLIDPKLEVNVEQLAPGDSTMGLLGIGGGAEDTGGTWVAGRAAAPETSAIIKRPVVITVTYDADVNFDTTTNLKGLWETTVRPWMIAKAQSYNPAGILVIVDQAPLYEHYENRVRANLTCLAYSTTIIRQRISYDDITAHGRILDATTDKDVFAYYDFPGPAVRQMHVVEDREERVSDNDARAYVMKLYKAPGSFSDALGDKWVLMDRDAKAHILNQGLSGASVQLIAYATVTSRFQFRNKKTPSIANAGGITGAVVTPG